MVLKILHAVGSAILPSQYYTHAVLAVFGIVTVYTFTQGRKTNRERDLHGRTILITAASHLNGAFTPYGLTLLMSLAQRGAHIIALTAEPPDTGPPATLVSLLRSTTSNENIYAEQCDLASPASIRAFCSNYHKSEQRLDALIFAHEYAPIGTLFARGGKGSAEDLEGRRRTASSATFLVVTLLLPLLLAAPVERDIRLIALVNPFYAAAARAFSASASSTPSSSSSLSFHFPRTDVNSQSIPVVSDKVQRSNIVAVSVSPGISRKDVIAPLLAADSSRGNVSPSTLHALFLPTPFKFLSFSPEDPQKRAPEEVLKPGALYAECAVVPARVPAASAAAGDKSDTRAKAAKDSSTPGGDGDATRPDADDGELGGVALGMAVWDEYERELKAWEAAEAAREAEKAKKEESKSAESPIAT
ncbi:hypothetical protein BC826DRAFT_1008863 [Russula brevipes]|nr:hypothetical protein BC826DRAFT_1008863 [Russula brevipes]